MNDLDLINNANEFLSDFYQSEIENHDKKSAYITVTFAQTLDAKISVKNKKVKISQIESMYLTHK